ncbi:hypothetical protein [Microbacterium immunditiarum]|uniref:Uncharacterized protein n=1 Tax=Microbacterium immunditiarum TaxID=337480 RepID=A0A7Y9GR83_9MICO|nr:hypothetical protein [Microbacterium immunditiarum]NYE21213.1 hypothetical protein [Microbacterium immunditiarum]
MEDARVSQAIVEYLAKGRSPFPKSDEDAVIAFAGGAEPEALLAHVKGLTGEMMSIEVDWSARTLSEGGREAQRIMAERHPELGQNALEALYWMFTYNWR